MVTSVKGAIQISGGIALWQYSSMSLSPSNKPAATTMPGVMDSTTPVVTPTCCGDKWPFSIEAAYGLSDNILLGGQVQLAGGSESAGDSVYHARQFAFSIGPKFDYQLIPTSRWNPFIGAVANVTLASKSYYNAKDSRTIFGLLARAGFRYFVLDQLSIDPILSIGAHFGSGSQNTDTPASNQMDYSLSGFDFALSMGISLWIK